MRIGQVAKKFDISVDTLHYWENVGIVPPVNKDSSGKRDYDKEDLGWVRLAVLMRQAGVGIRYLQKYVALFKQGPKTEAVRKRLLEKQLQGLDNKIAKFKASRHLLKWKIDHYDYLTKHYHGKLCKFFKK